MEKISVSAKVQYFNYLQASKQSKQNLEQSFGLLFISNEETDEPIFAHSKRLNIPAFRRLSCISTLNLPDGMKMGI